MRLPALVLTHVPLPFLLACSLLDPAGARLDEARALREAGDPSAEAAYSDVLARWPESEAATAARGALCATRSDRTRTAWAALGSALSARVSPDAVAAAGKEASDLGFKLNFFYQKGVETCLRDPNAGWCANGPEYVQGAQKKWAPAAHAWLNLGARDAADEALVALVASTDPLAADTDEVEARALAERENAATGWVRSAVAALGPEYREKPFNMTDTDPDAAAIGKEVAGAVPDEWKAVLVGVRAAREVCAP